MVDANYMTWAHRHNYRVYPWIVDSPDEMRDLIALGVDGIITNVPDVLNALLETKGGVDG